jgi:hypothetical protein
MLGDPRTNPSPTLGAGAPRVDFESMAARSEVDVATPPRGLIDLRVFCWCVDPRFVGLSGSELSPKLSLLLS